MSSSQLKSFIRDVVDLACNEDHYHVLEYIKDNYCPADVFDEKELSAWAKDNDFIHKDDIERE